MHPELCRIVPQFREGLASGNVIRGDGDESSPLIEGAVTWSVGGKTELPWFEGLTEREQRAGATFGVFPPSGYVVVHDAPDLRVSHGGGRTCCRTDRRRPPLVVRVGGSLTRNTCARNVCPMNITLSIDDRVVAKARRIAAVRGTSLNQLVRDYLDDLTRHSDVKSVLDELDSMWSDSTGHSQGPWAREELHERS